jgi:hypothetical protein
MISYQKRIEHIRDPVKADGIATEALNHFRLNEFSVDIHGIGPLWTMSVTDLRTTLVAAVGSGDSLWIATLNIIYKFIPE